MLLTAQAVEGGGCETLANLETAVELGVDRVGHALQLSRRPELMGRLKAAGVAIDDAKVRTYADVESWRADVATRELLVNPHLKSWNGF